MVDARAGLCARAPPSAINVRAKIANTAGKSPFIEVSRFMKAPNNRRRGFAAYHIARPTPPVASRVPVRKFHCTAAPAKGII